MSNSKLVDYIKISPNSTNPRKSIIRKITIHHMAGNLTVEQCGEVFATKNRKASSNYGIGSDGRIGLYVEENNRAWTSSNVDNDNQAITIEVANDKLGEDWHVSDKALEALIELCVDICERNNIKGLNFTGDKNGNLTMHKYFANTTCPGPYLESKFPYIADAVNKRFGLIAEDTFKPHVVKVTASELNIRSGPGTDYDVVGCIKDKGRYTIVEEKTGEGSLNGWGKLKSGAGWISMDYVEIN